MTLDGTVMSTLVDVTMTNVTRTDSVLATMDGGYCWTFYDDQDNEIYVELTADAARLLRDKLITVVDDEDWMQEESIP